jgi:uncharacterized delta-60 repeat protein
MRPIPVILQLGEHGEGVVPVTHRSGRRALLMALLFLVALWATLSGSALGAPGELDRSYGLDGWSRLDFRGVDAADALALRPDGKLVIAGFTGGYARYTGECSPCDFAVARLNPQGTLDTSFGLGDGWSPLDFGRVDAAHALAVQPDGKIVVAGSTEESGRPFFNDFAVARLNPQGALDTSFGLGGWSQLDFGPHEAAKALALQPDGKIVVAGSTRTSQASEIAVARLTPEGTLDTSFGLGAGYATSLALQPDGKLLVAGSSGNDFAVARLTSPQATLDPSYGIAGWSRLDFGPFDHATGLALQPDGKIVASGYTVASGKSAFAVARLNPHGALDTSFGLGDGWSRLDFGFDVVATALALQPDGKLLMAGHTAARGTYDLLVARLQPNGQLDSTFGEGGKWSMDFGGGQEFATALALQPDGKIVLAGYRNAYGNVDIVVIRLEGDVGPRDPGEDQGPGSPPSCAGSPATIIGTRGADRLEGTHRRDVIVALGGQDSVRARDGADLVCAGPGNDRVAGGGGRDSLRGERGRDLLRGQGGNDRLLGGTGRDSLRGGPGRDDLRGGPGRDRLQGGAGTDRQRQ